MPEPTAMCVTTVEAIPVRVPARATSRSALGQRRAVEAGIVIVTTGTGLQGVGEISSIWHGGGARLCADLEDLLAPAVIGLDPFALSAFHRIAGERLQFGRHTLPVIAAVEMALLDIQGKATGQPVYNLLGGLVRDRVELSMSIHMMGVEESVACARSYVEQGFTTVKIKVGLDAGHDLEVLSALRREFADLKIRVDANMAWRSAKEALPLIHVMERSRILSVEQPLSAGNLAGLRFLRERTEAPIVADESVWTPADAAAVVEAGAADILNIYASESGGLSPARQTADIARLSHLGVCIGSMPELGVGTAAHAHLAVSLPNLEHPSDVTGHLYQQDDVVVTPPPIHDGHAWIPPGPGLGVELDREKVLRYRIPRGSPC